VAVGCAGSRPCCYCPFGVGEPGGRIARCPSRDASLTESSELGDLARDAGTPNAWPSTSRPADVRLSRSICTVQLAWQSAEHLAVVDSLTAPVAGLAQLLGIDGPTKIVHDVAFDARLLGGRVELGNVHDTAIAAHMLGRPATGLASLLASELGIQTRQGHAAPRLAPSPAGRRDADLPRRRRRPPGSPGARPLARVTERGVEDEVLEETRYRLTPRWREREHPRTGPPMRGSRESRSCRSAIAPRSGCWPTCVRRRRSAATYRRTGSRRTKRSSRSPGSTHDAYGGVADSRVPSASPEARAFVDDIARAWAPRQ